MPRLHPIANFRSSFLKAYRGFSQILTKGVCPPLIIGVLLFLVATSCESPSKRNPSEKGTAAVDKAADKGPDSGSISKPDSTLEALGEAIVQRPNDPAPYLERAEFYRKRGRFKEAIDDMKKAVAIDSNRAAFHYKLGLNYYDDKQFGKARQHFAKCTELDDAHARAYAKLGEIDFLFRHYQHSMDNVNKALKHDKHLAEPYYLKGMIYKENGDTSRALSSFQTAVEMDPDYYEAYIYLGMLSGAKGNDLAIEYYNTASRIRPESVEPLYNKGLFCQEQGMYNKAIEAYTEVLDIESGHPNALFNLGYINLQHLKDRASAVDYFTKALRYQPGYYKAWYNRGLAYEKLGKLDSARADYKKTLSIKGDYGLAAKGLSRVKEALRQQGDDPASS